MFKAARKFYERAIVMATKTGAKEEAVEELLFHLGVTYKFDGSELEKSTELEDGAVTYQRKLIEMALEEKIQDLLEKKALTFSLKELDFRLQQELTSLGWILTEEEGRAVIYTYLPTAHM